MDQIHVVRHKVLVKGASIRKVAKEMGIARNTVRRYLVDTPPEDGSRLSASIR
jgi:transposase